MLQLPENLLRDIEAHGASTYPHEGCGLLLGQASEGLNVVEALLPVPNKWPNEEEKPVRFLIEPGDMIEAELTAAAAGQDVLGIFHSHPDHDPIASPRDLAWATWPGYSYLITAVRRGIPAESRSWQLLADRSGFTEEAVEIHN
ncbi:MAG: M67 family metallopeptidase [Anaerolineales bacterium]|nr:M67 family metallopeptidase [Anaerolineales bacterium]MCB0007201.1 M67 family metallopeptidase [Anaerolineales bacterium]MCB0017885.1 M67 family metallopeptidase [Anaerolineales bacterium]MCB0028170.1 M67 family metallopeptidase [Anaerolineales bacterium]